MILLWMLHATVLGVLAGAAALLAERALRLVGRPARGVWAAAVLLSVALPALRLAAPPDVQSPAGAASGAVDVDGGFLAQAMGATSPDRASWRPDGTLTAPAAWRRFDRPLLAAWVVASLLLLARVGTTAHRLTRQMRRWPTRAVGPTTVRIAPDLGPSVFGAWQPQLLLPRWALDDPRLPLMLAHEAAHVRGRDPLLLAVAGTAAVLLPWQLPLWWQLRRLRLAVEVDCDARVLADHQHVPAVVQAYGTLLLDVAGRTPPGRPPFTTLAPTLLSTPSTLSRRIHAMTASRPRHAAWRAAALTAAAPLLVAVACELPRPTAPRTRPQAPLTRLTTPVRATATAPAAIPVDRMRDVLAQAFPDAARERRGATQRVWFVQEASGRVTRVLRGLAADDSPVSLRDAVLAVERDGAYVRGPIDPAASGALAIVGVDAARIAAVDVRKLGPGQLGPDSTEAIWVRLHTADAVVGGAVRVRVSAPGSGAPSAPAPRDTVPPLYLVDGVEVTGGRDALPQPDRIESVDVLKGTAARREFGERGAHGVVRITTKPD